MLAPLFSLSEYLMDGWRYTSKTTCCPLTYSTIDKTDSASCTNVLLLTFILCIRSIPSMIQVDGVGIVSAGDTFFSNSLATVALFVFRRDPSAFASVHGSGPSVHGSGSMAVGTLLLSVTRIICLKKFRSAFRTTSWLFIRDVFVLIVENVFSLCIVILWNYTGGW